MSASTEESASHAAHYGRLEGTANSLSVGAWCAAVSNDKQYIQVDLGKEFTVTGIRIRILKSSK